MTGRSLYDQACRARAERPASGWDGEVPQAVAPAPWIAWDFLHPQDRSFWSALASRVSESRRRRTAR